MTNGQDWLALNPKLDSGSAVLEILRDATQALAALDWTQPDAIERIRQLRIANLEAVEETHWGDSQIARVCIAVFCDLRGQGWDFRVIEGKIQARKPTPNHETALEEKARIRAGLLLERDQQLREPATRSFVQRMEQRRLGPNGWTSICALMRDGRELAAKLSQAGSLPVGPERATALRLIIDPYIQPVDDSNCAHTGLALKDIWRYFRYTWANAPKTVPGRNFWFLIRDRAAPNHPVIGIAALGSAVVQLTVRDRWIGWHGDDFVLQLAADPSDDWARWVVRALAEQLDGIYTADFVEEGVITAADLSTPRPEVLPILLELGKQAKDRHQQFPKASEHKAVVTSDAEWEEKAHSYLFCSKRASGLTTSPRSRIPL